MSESLSDRVPGDAKTVSNGSLREALVVVELNPALPRHREQIEDCDDDQEHCDQFPRQESSGGEHW